jgi:hypothetical protein
MHWAYHRGLHSNSVPNSEQAEELYALFAAPGVETVDRPSRFDVTF